MRKRFKVDYGFCEDCPEDEDGLQYEIRRVGTGRSVKGIILSDTLICRLTHFWGNRTVPHHEYGCEPCHQNVEGRWKGWVAVFNPTTEAIVILEITAKGCKPLRTWRKEVGTLRGAEITATRIGKKENGRVFCSLARGPVASNLLPPAPDVQLCLLKLWGLQPGLPGLGIANPLNGHAASVGGDT